MRGIQSAAGPRTFISRRSAAAVAICSLAALASADADALPLPTLSGVHATEGVGGLQIEIPRLSPAEERLVPLFKWLDPAESMSPARFDLYPCRRWKCSSPHALTVRVNVRRVTAIGGAAKGEAESLRANVAQVIERAGIATHDESQKYPGMELDSLKFHSFDNGLWAKVERRAQGGRLAGVVYWRQLGPEFMMSASFLAETDDVPVADVEEFSAWFPEFVRRIGISGQPSHRRWP